ncbi:hypothetical protein [Streptomyces sp. NPDC088350]|uniref:hypothetical protein n=1 Tax=Streptomyces sp. NPDC088350 TaxID=3365854 RepID=UPI0037F13712
MPEPAPELRPEPEPEPEPEPAPRPRRRGRTTLLIAVAAVLGVVAGACAGFLVQANHAPDKLPSLSQATLTQAKGAAVPLSADQDRRVRTDGDLRKLLLKRPGGARDVLFPEGADGWLDLAGYAERFTKPDIEFGYLVGEEFRRAAVSEWREGTARDVEIILTQYSQEENLGASVVSSDADYWAKRDAGTDSWDIPGTGDGEVYVHGSKDGGYSAEAHAWRGDIAVEIWIYDSKPIPKKKIMDLAERQMERL